MANRIADEHHARLLEKWTNPCIEAMRTTARVYGYALTMHGSLAFDIDIVCIPWIEDADSAESLVSALREACSRVTGLPTVFAADPIPRSKPHGRLAWSWYLGGGPYIDCSVMPRVI